MLNARQEQFAQWVASGKSATEAYRLAGYAPADADVSGPRLLGNAGVESRIAELQEANAAHFSLSREQALEVLAEIICTPVGQITKDSRICQEYERTIVAAADDPSNDESAPVVKVKLKMPGKVEALKLAAAMNGWLTADQAANKQAGALESLAALIERVRT